jgi:hypothetical protein
MVGTHEILLTVVDTSGYVATDSANQISAKTLLDRSKGASVQLYFCNTNRI